MYMAKKILVLMILLLWLICGILIFKIKDSHAPTTKIDQLYIAFIYIAETIYLGYWLVN